MLRWLWFCWSLGILACMAHVTFTNLKCNFKNKTFGEFEYCHIKEVNRTHKYISLYGKLYLKPLDNITSTFKMLRFVNGYKPFFFDISFDVCKFLKYQRNSVINIFYNTFKGSSNLNHTCPYDHDLIIDKFWTGNLDVELVKYLAIPNGDYALLTTFYVKKMELVTVEIYVKITN